MDRGRRYLGLEVLKNCRLAVLATTDPHCGDTPAAAQRLINNGSRDDTLYITLPGLTDR